MTTIPSGLSAFVKGCCPQCRTGKLFSHPFYHPTKFKETRSHCPSCGVKIEPEPGFFWGAMYFSYAIIVAMCVLLGIILFLVYDDPPYWLSVGIIVGAILVTIPGIYRMSRLLMVYVTAPYRKFDPEKFHDESKKK